MLPSRLKDLLATPGSSDPLELVVAETAQGEPYSGWLEDAQGRVQGRLDRFRFSFLDFEPVKEDERTRVRREGPVPARAEESRLLSAFDPRIEWAGHAIDLEGFLRALQGDEAKEHFSLRTTARRVELTFHAHGWSGIARVEVDSTSCAEIDLFNRSMGVPRTAVVENPEGREVVISVWPTGRADARSQGLQVILESIREFTGRFVEPPLRTPQDRNRGGLFRSRFFEVLAELPADAAVLDIGGGRREVADPRYINLEYAQYDEPHVLGDALRLPFRDGSLDFVYSAAVLEHVLDPLKMGREIHRVLKPGGRVLANAAFMQPVHGEGLHFFNVTPYGIELIFDQFAERRVWWDASLAETVEWMVSLSGLRGKVEDARIDQFVSLARELTAHIDYDHGMYFASGVWLEAVKPQT